jgi:photosystem II stability/assembly factor-like uncharacterized protein
MSVLRRWQAALAGSHILLFRLKLRLFRSAATVLTHCRWGVIDPNMVGSHHPGDDAVVQSYVFAAIGGYFGNPDSKDRLGVFRRPAGDAVWEHVLAGPETYTVFVHPRDPSLVFAGTADGVYRSTDHGATFKRAKFPDQGVEVWSYLADPADPSRLLAGGSPVSIFRSDDMGESWTRLPDPRMPYRGKSPFACRVMRFARNPNSTQEIFAALEVGGVMRSIDGGESWSDCSDPLVQMSIDEPRLRSMIVSDTDAEGMLDAHAICMSPADPGSVILALRMGLFRSTDRGASWQDMRVDRFSPFTYGRDIKVSPQDPNTLYACLSVAASSKDGALFRSQDSGKTWQRFDKVRPHGTLMSVSLHPTDPKQVYVAARYGEVFGTLDGGTTWQETPLPADIQHIYALACG